MTKNKKPFSPFRGLIIKKYHKQFKLLLTDSLEGLKRNNPELLAEYEDQAQTIHKLVMQTKYWHGTGRFQYKTSGNSKYDGVRHSETFDVLEDVVKEGGLAPHYDPWFEKYVHVARTTSVANQWCYGKMYGHYHLYEEDSLLFEIAPAKFWYRVMIWIQMTENYCKTMFGFLILYTFSNALQNQGKIWMSTFRSDINKKWPFWKILTTQSDIKDNYSILFGIKDELKIIKIMTLAVFLESRTSEEIKFEKDYFHCSTL